MSTSSNSNSKFQYESLTLSPSNHSILFIWVTQLVTSDTSYGKCQYRTYCNPPSFESSLIGQDCSDFFSFWDFKKCWTNVWNFSKKRRFAYIEKIFQKTPTSHASWHSIRLIQINLVWTLRLAWHNVKTRSFYQKLELTRIGKYEWISDNASQMISYIYKQRKHNRHSE